MASKKYLTDNDLKRISNYEVTQEELNELMNLEIDPNLKPTSEVKDTFTVSFEISPNY